MANEISNRMHAGLTCSLYELTAPVLQQSYGVVVATLRRRIDLQAGGAVYSIDLEVPLGGRSDAAGLLVESEGILTWASVGGDGAATASCQLATADVPENVTASTVLGPYPASAALVFSQILIMAAAEGVEFENTNVPLVNILLVRSPSQ